MMQFRAIVEGLLKKLAQQGYYPTPIVDLGVLVARADGMIDETEMMLLKELFATALGEKLPTRVVEHLVTASQEVIEAAGVKPRLRLLAEILRDCDAMEEGLRIALAVAHVNSGVHEKESEIIHDLADLGGVPRHRVDALSKEAAHLRMPELKASIARVPAAPPSGTAL
jgi:tellurite resistance protein